MKLRKIKEQISVCMRAVNKARFFYTFEAEDWDKRMKPILPELNSSHIGAEATASSIYFIYLFIFIITHLCHNI